ncbi:zinc-binding alcohol dehydrogenase family protein [Georgenia halophila]|uniref:Zinc-binding alcohol dehydrogenase family protein n=1 Tax=Georgenia halophila TaxID=620889 RepID=A0ABP8KT20_9MICO
MRAGYLAAPGVVEVDDFPEPVAERAGDLVVRMHRASICGSDVHVVFHGFHDEDCLGMPGYPGHEGLGTVVESRSETVVVGDLVLTVPIPTVGRCFAEYQLIEDTQVVTLPAGGQEDRLLMAQQYGTALYAMRMFWPEDGTLREAGTAAITGAGSAGLFFLQLAQRAGFEHVVISDLDTRRLAVARDLGAGTTVHAPDESVTDAVMDLTGGAGADLVIEAAGYDDARAQTVAALAQQGTIGLFGYPERRGLAGFPMYDAFRKVARIQWAGGTQAEPGLVAFRDAVRHIHDGEIEVGHCLGHVHRLDDLPRALAVAAEGGHGGVKLSLDLR